MVNSEDFSTFNEQLSLARCPKLRVSVKASSALFRKKVDGVDIR
ncbi:hypothetical protein J2Z84_004877 [Agrobacterium rubi]|nr:hypothetical protein [Agrobacterium rubi]